MARATGQAAASRVDLRDVFLIIAGAVLAVLIVRQALSSLAPPPPPSLAALAIDPMDSERLASRALALEASGHEDLAAPILDFAGRLGWRDPRVQVRLFVSAVQGELWPEAMDHADALLRTDGEGRLRPWLFAWLNQSVAFEAPRAALVQRLEAPRAWWREAWLAQLGVAATAKPATADLEGARALLLALAASPSPPTPAEYGPYVARMAIDGDAAGALADWRALSHRTGTAQPRDGDFIGPADGTPFTWRMASGVGATSAIEASSGASGGKALRVDYDGFSTPSLPAQLLVLDPGAWRLTWRERAAGTARMAWRVRCAASNVTLAQGAPAAAADWAGRRIDFSVPASGCVSQWLELVPNPGERREETTAWYADMSLARPPPGRPA